MAKKKDESLVVILLSGLVAGFVLSIIFSLSTSTSMKLFVIIGFMFIGLMVSYAFWRSLNKWI